MTGNARLRKGKGNSHGPKGQHPGVVSVQDGCPNSIKSYLFNMCTAHGGAKSTVFFLYPDADNAASASCTTSVYVNLSKNSSLGAIANFSAKADAKVRQKTIPSKYFSNYFSENKKIFRFLDENQENGLHFIPRRRHV